MARGFSNVSKAIAGGVAGGIMGAVSTPGTASIVIPDGVETPWWGYAIVGALNILAYAAIGALAVYRARANTPG